ncbi:MAG: bifunctional demethylmenaquinone methyltransferase/2-methoxy-6-polyprenyl-1,4-benzoquinol methylase UbiE [Desulfotalea sp.]
MCLISRNFFLEVVVSKGASVQKMFDGIAGRYDLMNKVMTMGQDQRWRRFVVAKAGDVGAGRVLDLATGTGDIAALLALANPQAQVTGGDFSLNMLEEAKNRFAKTDISWQECDANNLPFENDTFDAVTFGYLLRNVDDSLHVLREIYRVLKPGGRIVCLDTTPPRKNILYPFLQCYFRYGIPLLGRMIASDDAAYSYLTGSTMEFHSAEVLADFFSKANFVDVDYKKFMLGTIGVHWGVK